MSLVESAKILLESVLQKRWFHGTSADNASKIKSSGYIEPSQPSQDQHDIPRADAVYITTDITIAKEYASSRDGFQSDGHVFEVEVSGRLEPDEDVIWDALNDASYPSPDLSRKIRNFWTAMQNKEAVENGLAPHLNFQDAFDEFQSYIEENDISPSENMIRTAVIITKQEPILARRVIDASGKAAHIGRAKIKQLVEEFRNDMATESADTLEEATDPSRIRSLLKKHRLKGVNKPKRTPDHPTKSHVVLAKDGDRAKLIRFGQQGVSGAGKNPTSKKQKKRRASFKARHKSNIKRGRMSAAYWADRVKW